MSDKTLPNLVVPQTSDFIEMPAKNIEHRGVTFSRSTLIRLANAGRIKTTRLRFTGTVKFRRVILRESLDALLDEAKANAK